MTWPQPALPPLSARDVQHLTSRIKAAKFKDAQQILQDYLNQEFQRGWDAKVDEECCSL